MPIVPFFDPATGASGGPSSGGGATLPLWLDIPTTVVNVTGTVPPGPSGSVWTVTLPLPTNAVGNTYYRIHLATRADNGIPWRNWNNTTRVLQFDSTVLVNSVSTQPDVFRFEVTDDAGNYGVGYMIFGNWINVSPRFTTLPEIVLEHDDPPLSYTFTPYTPGAVGSDDTSPFTYAIGTGSVSGQYALVDRPSSRRFQGPFTVDVPQGGALFLPTVQELGTAGGQIVVQPFRRRMPNGLAVAGTFVRDYELDCTILSTGTIPMPIVGAPSAQSNTPTGNPSYYDFATVNTQVLSTGTAATVEQANTVFGEGLVTELQSTATNSRGIGNSLTALVYNGTQNTGRVPCLNNVIPISDEVVFRCYGRIDLTNASTSNTGFVDWFVTSLTNVDGISGLRFQLNQGMTAGFNANDYVSVSVYQAPSTHRRRMQVLRTDLLSRDIGMDVYARGGTFAIVLYQWPGSWPDLNVRMPYAGTRHWCFEHARNLSTSWAAGEPDFNGSRGRPWEVNSQHGQNFLNQAVWGAYVSLGNAGAMTSKSVIKRVAVEHRPRNLVYGV